MKYHDFRLRGYSVEEFGNRIVFDLVFDHTDQNIEESKITFLGVACYSFNHTTGAIITDIEEFDVASLAREEEQKLVCFAREHGLKHWKNDIVDYISILQKEKLRGWKIDSAIGFGGFVIARSVEGST